MDFFWEKKEWEDSDPHLQRLCESPFQRKFPFIPTKPGIYFIRGPRQIGKSSWLKTILQTCAKQQSCFYMSCENVRDHIELAEVLRSVRGRHMVLLDEISFVKEWARAVKHEADSGHLHILVLTGSHAADLRRGMDRMPGRWGNGGEFCLLPMSFEEFEQARQRAGWLPDAPVHLAELECYLRVGGFPRAVVEAGQDGKTPREAMDTYLRWLKGDFARFSKQELYLRELMGQLALSMGSSISLQRLAQKTQLGSHHTVQEYISLLEDCFALRTLYAVDENTGGLRLRKEKKFYFTDPLIFWIALEWSGFTAGTQVFEQLAEMIAHEALSARYKRLGYVSQQKGEIDFYLHKQWALEVKWSAVAHNLSKAFRDLRIPNKYVWTQQNILREWPATY